MKISDIRQHMLLVEEAAHGVDEAKRPPKRPRPGMPTNASQGSGKRTPGSRIKAEIWTAENDAGGQRKERVLYFRKLQNVKDFLASNPAVDEIICYDLESGNELANYVDGDGWTDFVKENALSESGYRPKSHQDLIKTMSRLAQKMCDLISSTVDQNRKAADTQSGPGLAVDHSDLAAGDGDLAFEKELADYCRQYVPLYELLARYTIDGPSVFESESQERVAESAAEPLQSVPREDWKYINFGEGLFDDGITKMQVSINVTNPSPGEKWIATVTPFGARRDAASRWDWRHHDDKGNVWTRLDAVIRGPQVAKMLTGEPAVYEFAGVKGEITDIAIRPDDLPKVAAEKARVLDPSLDGPVLFGEAADEFDRLVAAELAD